MNIFFVRIIYGDIERRFLFFRGVLGVGNVSVDEIAEKLLQQAKEEGEAYIATLTPEELKSTGFEEDDDFWDFDHVDIYLLYDGRYRLKYVFDDDYRNTLYESEDDLYGRRGLLEIVQEYLSFRGGK